MDFIFIVLFIAIVYAVYFLYTKYSIDSFNPVEEEKLPHEENKEFTLEELGEYNGIKKKQVYLAVKDVVYNVTHSEAYGKGGSYDIFGGKDASIALAKMAMEEKWLNVYDAEASKLTNTENKTLDDWFGYMNSKYKKVGTIKRSAKSPTPQ